MSAPGTQTARGARDILAGLLGLGVPYPLRDLLLDYAADVPHDLSTDILVRGAQSGVVYQLCTEEGAPLQGKDGQPISAELSADQGGEPTLASTPVFIPGDLRDAAGLLRQLTPASAGVGALLRRRFQPGTLTLLDAASGGDEAVRAAVLKDLSDLVRQGALYDAAAFRDVCLSPWTRQLLQRAKPTGTELVRLNRFLLEDAFPFAIWRTLTLPTPSIEEDVTFTVLASRKDNGLVETPLAASASIRAGISATLPVRFPPEDDTVAVVAYGGTPFVAVDESQEGISYQLFSDQAAPFALSAPQPGNRVTVLLAVNVPLNEDTGIKVKAFRTSAPATFTFLKATVQVKVGPNPAVAVQAVPAVADFNGTPLFSLTQAQTTAQYTLWQRPVAPEDYLPPDPANPGLPVLVPADPAADPPWFRFVGTTVVVNGQRYFKVLVSVPDLGDGTQVPAGFTVVGDFKIVGSTPQVATAPLPADTLFVVQAKKQNGQSLLLGQQVVMLVRPDPQPTLSAPGSPVVKGTPGLVLVGNAQSGVRYRLLHDADGTPVLNPGYHHDDRGLETTRLETDFIIEAPGDPTIALPTDPINALTKFRVVAIKNATALTAQLKATVSMDVTAPPPPTASPRGGA